MAVDRKEISALTTEDNMLTVTMVCTMHKQAGICNPVELCRIIKQISPDVIFEELSQECFDLSYVEQRLKTLETDAIKLYLHGQHVKHIAVDTYELPKHYHVQLGRLYDLVTCSVRIAECRSLRMMLDDHNSIIANNGLNYLNSSLNDHAMTARAALIRQILNTIDNEDMWLIHAMEKEVIEKREIEILTNIYGYSRQHSYERALFFIGSGHRETIIKKIAEFNSKENTQLNWMIRVNDDYVSLSDLCVL